MNYKPRSCHTHKKRLLHWILSRIIKPPGDSGGGKGDAMTQNNRVLLHMQTHKGISTIEAFELYGVTRLSARIWELRHEGHRIKGESRTGINRYGKKVTYLYYQLVG